MTAGRELIERLTIEGSRLKARHARPLSRYLSADFLVEYPPEVDLAAMPRAIALLPFLWNVAPIAWATDQHFVVDELDPRVAESFEAVRAELRTMYPSLAWRGSVSAPRHVEPPAPPAGRYRVASLYTGGIDSTWTALRHAGPDLLLIRIWGSDVRFADAVGWQVALTQAREFASAFGGGVAYARSTFRSISYRRLAALTPEIGEWFTAVQHSLAFAGLAAPLLYHHGIPVLRIGSTFTDAFSTNWGSLPRIDDRVSLAGARLVHDSFDASRQDKVAGIVAFQRERGVEPWPLHVCWVAGPKRENCGRCEKCVRTIVGLLLVGADPAAHGFADPPLLDEVRAMVERGSFRFGDDEVYMWGDLQRHARAADKLDGEFWGWLRGFDFEAFRRSQPARPAARTKFAWLDRLAPRLYDRLRDTKRAMLGRPRRR